MEALRRGQLADMAGHSEINEAVQDIHQGLSEVGVQLHPPMSYQYAEAATAAADSTPPLTISAEAAPEPAKPKAKQRAKTPATKKPAATKTKTRTASSKPRTRTAKS